MTVSIRQQLIAALLAENVALTEKRAANDRALTELHRLGDGDLPHHHLMSARRRGITKAAPASSTAVHNVVDNTDHSRRV